MNGNPDPVDLEYVARDLERLDSPRAAKKLRACMTAWLADREKLAAILPALEKPLLVAYPGHGPKG